MWSDMICPHAGRWKDCQEELITLEVFDSFGDDQLVNDIEAHIPNIFHDVFFIMKYGH